jgi:putative membrane protein
VTARDGSAQLAAGTQELANKVDTTVDPLIDALGRVSNLGLDPEEVGRAAEHLSGAVRSTTDRISALNINTARPRRSSIRRSPSCATTRIRRCETPASSWRGAAAAARTEHRSDHRRGPGEAAGQRRLVGERPRQPRQPAAGSADQGSQWGLRADVVKLRDGVNQLHTGAHQLSGGLVKLSDGGSELARGAGQLAAGTPKLRAAAPNLPPS